MAVNPLGALGPASIAGAGSVPKVQESFGQVLKQQVASAGAGQVPGGQPGGPALQGPMNVAPAGQTHAAPGVSAVGPTGASSAGQVIDHVSKAQSRMDEILKLAESGKSFSPAELLSLQAQVYRASQELDLAGKVVEKATGGVKQVLQQQV